MSSRRPHSPVDRSEFAGFRFPPDVIAVAVRWYLRYGLSYRDVEELLADAARPSRHAVGQRWFVDETYVKVSGRWRYLYRAIDQFGQVVDVYLSARRDARAARAFFDSAIALTQTEPIEVVTDRAHAYVRVIEDTIPAAWHHIERYANNPIECDHGRLKARLRPMRGLKRQRSALVVVGGHAFVQNLRRGHYELGMEVPANRRVAAAFAEIARAI